VQELEDAVGGLHGELIGVGLRQARAETNPTVIAPARGKRRLRTAPAAKRPAAMAKGGMNRPRTRSMIPAIGAVVGSHGCLLSYWVVVCLKASVSLGDQRCRVAPHMALTSVSLRPVTNRRQSL
jgi:hypothetical protein